MADCTCVYIESGGSPTGRRCLYRDPLCPVHYEPPRYVWPDGSLHTEPYTERVGKHGGCG